MLHYHPVILALFVDVSKYLLIHMPFIIYFILITATPVLHYICSLQIWHMAIPHISSSYAKLRCEYRIIYIHYLTY